MARIEFFDKLADALRAARNTDLLVLDGPEDNFAVMDREAAAELRDCAPEEVVSAYGFWSIAEAEAYDPGY